MFIRFIVFVMFLLLTPYPTRQLDLLRYDADGQLQEESIIPLIDGGTEGIPPLAPCVLPCLPPTALAATLLSASVALCPS